MSGTFLKIGPTFRNGPTDTTAIQEFRQLINDVDALGFFDLWSARCDGTIPDKKKMDPLDFMHLLPQIILEEEELEKGGSRVRLAGEFYRDLYPEESDVDLHGAYGDRWDDSDVIKNWLIADEANYREICPTLLYYSLKGVGKNHTYIGELSLPLFEKKDKIIVFGFTWKITKETFGVIIAI